MDSPRYAKTRFTDMQGERVTGSAELILREKLEYRNTRPAWNRDKSRVTLHDPFSGMPATYIVSEESE